MINIAMKLLIQSKYKIMLLLMAATVITACKKNDNNNPVTQPVELLSKITDNTPGHAAFGKPIDVFTYNGKQLTNIVSMYYNNDGSIFDVATDSFNYNTQGQLTGTTITYTNQNPQHVVSSVITYTGNDISDIKFYLAGNVFYSEATATYQNGNLIGTGYSYPGTNDFYSLTQTYSYIYNSGNQCTGIPYVLNYYSGPNYKGTETIYSNTETFTTFDSKQNVSKTVPFWFYCENRTYLPACYNPPQSLNNPINVNVTYSNSPVVYSSSYSYLYNTDGYPTTISYTDPTNPSSSNSFNYEYVKAN